VSLKVVFSITAFSGILGSLIGIYVYLSVNDNFWGILIPIVMGPFFSAMVDFILLSTYIKWLNE
jgi:hypothetical protein